MNAFAALALTYFLGRIDVFLLMTVRVLSFIIILPVLSGSSLTNIAKVLFAVSVAFMLFTNEIVVEIPIYSSVLGFLALVVQEFFVGITMGFVVYLFFTTIYLAGQLMDYQIGFSMVQVMDPFSQIQVPITGNLIYFFMATLLVVSGGLHVLISALAYSFEAIPIGRSLIFGNEKLYLYVVGLVADYLNIGLRMSMPVVGAILIIDVALGILVKAVPQMNVFVVGMPIKVLAGLMVLYITIPAFVSMFDMLFDASYKAVSSVIGGMSP